MVEELTRDEVAELLEIAQRDGDEWQARLCRSALLWYDEAHRYRPVVYQASRYVRSGESVDGLVEALQGAGVL